MRLRGVDLCSRPAFNNGGILGCANIDIPKEPVDRQRHVILCDCIITRAALHGRHEARARAEGG